MYEKVNVTFRPGISSARRSMLSSDVFGVTQRKIDFSVGIIGSKCHWQMTAHAGSHSRTARDDIDTLVLLHRQYLHYKSVCICMCVYVCRELIKHQRQRARQRIKGKKCTGHRQFSPAVFHLDTRAVGMPLN